MAALRCPAERLAAFRWLAADGRFLATAPLREDDLGHALDAKQWPYVGVLLDGLDPRPPWFDPVSVTRRRETDDVKTALTYTGDNAGSGYAVSSES